MGLYNRVTGSTGNETRIKEPKPFKPIELEQAFGGAYRSYRVNGRPKIDVDTFFNRIRKELIGLIERELKTRTSARTRLHFQHFIKPLDLQPLAQCLYIWGQYINREKIKLQSIQVSKLVIRAIIYFWNLDSYTN